MMKYLRALMEGKKLYQNTLIVSPPGSGKTKYVFDVLCINKKVLYLCDNSNLQEQVLLEDNTWIKRGVYLKKGFSRTSVEVRTYKSFGCKIRNDIDDDYINSFELIIADEIHNLIDYQSFNDDADLSHAIRVLMKRYDNTQIVMFTATPYYLEQLCKNNPGVYKYFKKIDFTHNKEIMRYVDKKKSYINHMSQIQFILEDYKIEFKQEGLKCLIYTGKIEEMKYIENLCRTKEYLNPISIWSKNNEKYIMNECQLDIRNCIIKTGELAHPYNVLIINRSTETGVNIEHKKNSNKNMKLVIVNTTNITQQIQARGRIRHDVDMLVLRNKEKDKVDVIDIPRDMLDRWLLKEDLQNLIDTYQLKNERGQLMTVNNLNKLLAKNYEVEDTRKTVNKVKRTYYRVSDKRTKKCTS